MTIAGLTTDSAVSVVALPVYSDFQSNIFVDSVWLRSPVLQNGLSNEIGIRIVNEGGKDVKGVPVTLDIDGQKWHFLLSIFRHTPVMISLCSLYSIM